jgi:hypothetical protein
MPDLIVNSDNALQDAFGIMRELYVRNRYLKVSIKIGKARSLDQNALSFAWYEQLGRELRDDNVSGWRCYCKLYHAVPIMRAEDEQFRAFYDTSIKLLTYEQKMKAMEFVPVTSLMSKKQLSAYLEAVQADFMQKGVKLDFPHDEKQVY